MPDVFANITGAPPEALEMIANVLELRAAIPQQQEMLRTYLRDIDFPEGDFHPGIEHATVISGSAHWGMGEKFEADKLRAMPAGSFIMICAGAPHFGQITEDTIIQAHGMGPWRTTSEALHLGDRLLR